MSVKARPVSKNLMKPRTKLPGEGGLKPLVCLDARVKNIEAKFDTLAVTMSNLTLIMKTSHISGGEGRPISNAQAAEAFKKGCLYCQKPDHGANKCLQNPKRNRSCIICCKKGHGPKICWKKQRYVP